MRSRSHSWSLPMSVHGCWPSFMGGCLHSLAGVMSWVLVICGWGSLLLVLLLLFVVMVAVLGAGLSFVGGGACLWAVYIIHGWGPDVCGLWLLYMCGVGWSWVIDVQGGRGFAMGSSLYGRYILDSSQCFFCICISVLTSVYFFLCSGHLSWILPVHCLTLAILHLFMILKVLGPSLMVMMFLCPGANAMQNEQAFADISFKVFNEFITQNCSSKITLATVLMLLFSTVENILNLHRCQQNLQLSDSFQMKNK